MEEVMGTGEDIKDSETSTKPRIGEAATGLLSTSTDKAKTFLKNVRQSVGEIKVPNLSDIKIPFIGGSNGISAELLSEINRAVESPFFIEKGIAPENVEDCAWGLLHKGTVDRQGGKFYRLVIEEKHVNGFLITLSSIQGKFKVMVFDRTGKCVCRDDATKTKGSGYSVTLFNTKFPTYKLEPTSVPTLKNSDVHLISFDRLTRLEVSNNEMSSGPYLIVICGDNLIGKTEFELMTVPCDEIANSDIVAADTKVLRMKEELAKMKEDYLTKKAALEQAQTDAGEASNRLDELLSLRNQAYEEYLCSAKAPFIQENEPKQSFVETAANNVAAAATAASTAASKATALASSSVATVGVAAGSAVTSVTAGASAAREWFGKRLSGSIFGGKKDDGSSSPTVGEASGVTTEDNTTEKKVGKETEEEK